MSDASVSPEVRSQVARSILTKNLGVRPGERVAIEGWSHTAPWAVAVAREARRLKAHPVILYEDEASYWDSIAAKEDGVLGAFPAHEAALVAKTDVYLHFWGGGDRGRFAELPDARQEKILAWNAQWYKLARKTGLRGARLDLGRLHPKMAERYGVDLSAWEQQLVQGSLADPKRLKADAAGVARALGKRGRLRIRADNGTDLTLALAGRPARVAYGVVTPADRKNPFGMLTNIPGGLVRVALDEGTAEGTFVANRSSYSDASVARGGVFHFKDGRLTDAAFDTGGELFEKPYKAAKKGRDQPGLLSIGLNPGLHDTPQLEDVERGAVLVSVGGNAFLGGRNTASNFGFAINAGASLELDGRPIPIPR